MFFYSTELQVLVMDINDHRLVNRLDFTLPAIPTCLQVSEDMQYAVVIASTRKSSSKVQTLFALGLEVEKGKLPESNTYKYRSGTKYRNYGATGNVLLTNALSIAVGLNGDLQMWDITTCKYEGNLYQDPGEKDTANPSLHNHSGRPLNHVIISDDRRYLVCGGGDGVASVWDLNNEILIFSYKGHQAPVSRLF